MIECVPNVSEGRDAGRIRRITDAVANGGARLLAVEPDADYNRTVITFVGEERAVEKSAFLLVSRALEEIDMRSHKGAHPRIGAADVVPFVPLEGASMEQCIALSRRVGKRIGQELGVPVYFYGKSARPGRILLSDIRKGEYEALREKLSMGEWLPDAGPAEWGGRVARAGAVVVGARDFLIAYNVNLATQRLDVAKDIAAEVRTSGRSITLADGSKKRIPGALQAVQAMGVALTRGSTQISMNLLDMHITGLHRAFSEVKVRAEGRGVKVTGSEIVGLVPKKALLDAGKAAGGEGGERKLVAEAISFLGLGDFAPEEKVIEYMR